MPGAFSASARVPSGLPGPGGITSGSPAPQPFGAGLCQLGLTSLCTTFQVPRGVEKPGRAVATWYRFTILRPWDKVSWLLARLTATVVPASPSETRGRCRWEGSSTVVGPPARTRVLPLRVAVDQLDGGGQDPRLDLLCHRLDERRHLRGVVGVAERHPVVDGLAGGPVPGVGEPGEHGARERLVDGLVDLGLAAEPQGGDHEAPAAGDDRDPAVQRRRDVLPDRRERLPAGHAAHVHPVDAHAREEPVRGGPYARGGGHAPHGDQRDRQHGDDQYAAAPESQALDQSPHLLDPPFPRDRDDQESSRLRVLRSEGDEDRKRVAFQAVPQPCWAAACVSMRDRYEVGAALARWASRPSTSS